MCATHNHTGKKLGLARLAASMASRFGFWSVRIDGFLLGDIGGKTQTRNASPPFIPPTPYD